MPDVRIVRANEPYRETATVRANRKSALNLVTQILAMTDLAPRHHREQLSIALWKWTEAEGLAPHAKYNTRYLSAGVKNASGPAKINHEHVWTRKSLTKELMRRSWTEDELRSYLLAYGVACIVTVEEHGLLGPTKGEGWQRYAQAGIDVWDRQTGDWKEVGLDGSISKGLPAVKKGGKGMPITAVLPDVSTLIEEHAKPPLVATQLLELLRTSKFCSAVAVPSYKRTGELSAFFRLHDAMIEEPTGAVAYVHWSGKVDLRLQVDDVPSGFLAHPAVKELGHRAFGVSCKITDDSSRAVTEELLFLALEKLRAKKAEW